MKLPIRPKNDVIRHEIECPSNVAELVKSIESIIKYNPKLKFEDFTIFHSAYVSYVYYYTRRYNDTEFELLIREYEKQKLKYDEWITAEMNDPNSIEYKKKIAKDARVERSKQKKLENLKKLELSLEKKLNQIKRKLNP